MNETAEDILLERTGDIARITLNQPERRNPLTVPFIERMLDLLDEIERDEGCRVAILTARGKAFCAGADLGKVVHPDGMPVEEQFALVRGFNRVVGRMRRLDVPVIAAVNGVAVGGGAALVLACDFAIASEAASLMFSFGRIGAASADMGCTWLLPRLVGAAEARRLLFTGAKLDAREAHRLGLFSGVVAADRLDAEVERVASEIVAASPRFATAATKLALELGQGVDLETALGYEAHVQSLMFQTQDHRKRLRELLAKK